MHGNTKIELANVYDDDIATASASLQDTHCCRTGYQWQNTKRRLGLILIAGLTRKSNLKRID